MRDPSEPVVVYTIGHSSNTAEDFVSLLHQHGIRHLVDVRSYPGSKRFPWFGRDELSGQLKAIGIVYHWAGKSMGGKRPVPDHHPHGALTGCTAAYAEHMRTEPFRLAMEKLISLSGSEATVVMCAERNVEQCHRSMIADYLLTQKVGVRHIVDHSTPELHRLTDKARVVDGQLIYDRNQQSTLFD